MTLQWSKRRGTHFNCIAFLTETTLYNITMSEKFWLFCRLDPLHHTNYDKSKIEQIWEMEEILIFLSV